MQLLHALGLLQQVGADKDQQRAEQCGSGRHCETVEKGDADLGVEQAHLIVAPARRQVVGPERGEGGEHGHSQHGQHQGRDQAAIQRHQLVVNRRRLGRVGHGASRQHGGLTPVDKMIDAKGQQRRCQQQNGHYRALGKVLLADDQLEDVGRQHVEIAADHLGDAEVGHDQREGHQCGGDQAVLGPGQCDGEEFAQHGCSHGVGGLVQARIRQAQGCHQDHQRVGKYGQTLGQHDSRRAVDLADAECLHPALQDPLIAKPVDQGNGR